MNLKPFWALTLLATGTGCATTGPIVSDESSWEQQSSALSPEASIPQGTPVTVQAPGAAVPPNTCRTMYRTPVPIAETCNGISPEARFVVNRLITLWGTYPTRGICSYGPEGAISLTGACGPALPFNAAYCPANDAILWDYTFLQSQLMRFQNFAPVLIIAHEWGHLNQARNNLTFDLTRMPIQNELHADCQAGIFTAVEEAAGYLAPGDIHSAFSSLCDAGDRNWAWFNPNGHGTCADRLTAFQHGYHNARQRLHEVCGSHSLAAMMSICRN